MDRKDDGVMISKCLLQRVRDLLDEHSTIEQPLGALTQDLEAHQHVCILDEILSNGK